MIDGIPATWIFIPLAEAGRWGSGGTPKRTEPAYYTNGTIPWLVIGDLTDGDVSRADTHITKLGLDNSSAKVVPVGAVLIAMYGSIGKLGINTIPCATNQAIAFCVPDHALVELRYLFKSLFAARRSLIDQGKGGAQQNISQEILKSHEIPLAPLHEQRRIVAKLDALQSRTRLAREALAAIPAFLDHYRQSVLAAAFRGELTAEWRLSKKPRTSVSVALASIETPARPARYGNRTETVTPGNYALAVGNPETELPDGWQWVPLVDIARLESGHTPSRQHPEWWNGEVPWVSIPDARDNHGRVIEKTTSTTNRLGLANSAARLLPAGTVCLCRTAASIGYVTVFGRPMATSQDFVNWICTDAIDPHWLKYLLIVEYQALLRFSKGSAHKTIYFPEVLSFHVALPPIEEQRQMVLILERQMRRIDDLQTLVDAALARCSSIDQSLLAAAFRGELVPQDPTDEPASVLLDRIRAARAEADQIPRAHRPRAPTAAPATTRAAEPTAAYRAGDSYSAVRTALRKRGSLANSDAQDATGLDAAEVRPILQRLVAEGHARVEGQKRGTRYVSAANT